MEPCHAALPTIAAARTDRSYLASLIDRLDSHQPDDEVDLLDVQRVGSGHGGRMPAAMPTRRRRVGGPQARGCRTDRGQPAGTGWLSYGVITGQGVAPLVVQVMRPWMAGLIGVLAVR